MVGKRFIWMIENLCCLKFEMFEDFGGEDVLIDLSAAFEYISIQVRSKNLYSNFSIAFLDSEGSPLLWREQKNKPKNFVAFSHIKMDTIFGSMRTKFLPNDTLRLQCLCWNNREDLIEPLSYFVCSRSLHTEVIEKTFSWKIASISSLETDRTREQVELFTSEGDAKVSTSRGDVLTIRLFLGTSLKVKLSASSHTAQVKCIISVLDVKGKIIQFADEEYYFKKMDEVWTIDIPITKDMLEYYRKEFLPDDTLSLVFAYTFCHDNTIRNRRSVGEDDIFVKKSLPIVPLPLASAPSTRSDEPENKQQSLPNNNISRALMGILEEGFMSDFSFRVQDKTFPVHKIILSARSSVFRAMFTADMKEKDSSSVDIPDVEADTFQRMLTFIYSDTFEDDMQWESASKLYSVADKYALEPLKQKCSRLLKTGLSVSSVLDVLLLGDAHQDEDLKAAALDFVARHDKKIVGSERWRRFAEENLQLSFDTLQKLYEKKMNA